VSCEHADTVQDVQPRTDGCEECLASGDRNWLSLHMCTVCGHVGCCASSPGKHAKQHYEETGHPVIRSVRQGWLWCYPDKQYV
jgi:uncharacterized UBP type Zn finger protein